MSAISLFKTAISTALKIPGQLYGKIHFSNQKSGVDISRQNRLFSIARKPKFTEVGIEEVIERTTHTSSFQNTSQHTFPDQLQHSEDSRYRQRIPKEAIRKLFLNPLAEAIEKGDIISIWEYLENDNKPTIDLLVKALEVKEKKHDDTMINLLTRDQPLNELLFTALTKATPQELLSLQHSFVNKLLSQPPVTNGYMASNLGGELLCRALEAKNSKVVSILLKYETVQEEIMEKHPFHGGSIFYLAIKNQDNELAKQALEIGCHPNPILIPKKELRMMNEDIRKQINDKLDELEESRNTSVNGSQHSTSSTSSRESRSSQGRSH